MISEREHVEYQQHLSLWGKADFKLNRTHNAKSNQPLTCHLRFAGQYADDESGLYYNRHRYYNPAVGQYISPDPIGLLGGFNPYGYVFDPTGFVDPLGLKGCSRLSYEQRKQLRTDVYNAKRQPKGDHSIKHTRAKTPEQAREFSLGLNTKGGRPEASYLPEYANKVAGLEKQVAYGAIRNGRLYEHGGTRFMFYENPTGAVGYNNGNLTNWVRIEMTNSPIPTIHSFPASLSQVSKYVSGI